MAPSLRARTVLARPEHTRIECLRTHCLTYPTAPRPLQRFNKVPPPRDLAADCLRYLACGSVSPPLSATRLPQVSCVLPATSPSGFPTFIYSSAFGSQADFTRSLARRR